ncbi:efflux RND transporter permease subunit [Alkalibacillus haloalkaliphilus]|uniref:efflux RND transporter permease subunit n=1 Tax=Alkalibacillus haloalkaliphilus TaxID=94136 RepID=UPI00293641D8|nr:efflux RND transporter permease subunit [Alkalibacillus haloalkaliphilus]MDV2581350.1 efflux RND transporter permease subunit [Alkalibacillus haloalkaliphilus]
MGWLKAIIQRKILVGLLVAFIFMIGSYAVLNLDRELLPTIHMNGALVEVTAGDMPASEVENTITDTLETQIQGIDGVESTYSTTSVGQTTIQIMFEGSDGDDIYSEIESIAHTSSAENNDIQDVFAFRMSTDQDYEFFMDISGDDLSEMSAFATEILEPRIESLREVNDVALDGLYEQELVIEFNRDDVNEHGIEVNQVINLIHDTNDESVLGELENDDNSPTLRWDTQLESIEQVENLQIPYHNGYVALDEIADVSIQPSQNTSYVWKDGTKDFIFVQIGRVSDVTQIEMASAVRSEIEDIHQDGLVDGFEVNELVAEADYVESSLDGVTQNIIIGGILALAVLLLFLRNIRATFIIGLTIPTSILLTFTTMWLIDYSFNILTLIALGLGIGMMIDASIVILESIYRKKEQGFEKIDAVMEGIKEVATAVIASMLTTIVVFVPIGLLGGDVGQFMIVLSLVVAITLISSVVVSFTLIPALAERFLRLKDSHKNKEDGVILRNYGNFVAKIVKRKRNSLAVIAIFILMFVGSLFLVTRVPITIMPDMMDRYAELIIDIEPGLSEEEQDELVQQIHESLSPIQDVESNYVMEYGSMYFVMINMTKDEEITRQQGEVNEEISSTLRALSDSQPINNVQDMMSGGGGAQPVQVNLKGDEFDQLLTISDDFINELEQIDGVVDASSSIDRTSIEEVIELNEDAILDAGLSHNQIKQFIEQSFMQMHIGEMTINNDDMPISVRWSDVTTTQADLLDLAVPTPDGEQDLANFISLNKVEVPNQISRIDGDRFASITADIEGRDLGSINRDVQSLLNDYNAPEGYSLSVAGDLEQQQELMQEMLIILGISIFLVYLVMAVQFNHLFHPVIIMSVIPMTIVGVIVGLFITQRELSVLSAMGIVMLIGIVLNNAILYIDRTNQLRRSNYSVEGALVEAGKNRIRPIFMTSLTTVGGMLPLALATGAGGNYQAPMATVIIAGLLFSTFITLVLVPAVYKLFTFKGKKEKRKRSRRRKSKDQLDESQAVS